MGGRGVTPVVRPEASKVMAHERLFERGGSMTGTILRFYVHENRTHKHMSLFEWLLEQAKKMGIHGGSAFRAIAGFGRHGVLHEEHFFELAADMTVQLEFVVSDAQADQLLALLKEQHVSIFYARVAAEFGTIEGDR
jgi:PII-like signaling protein